MPMSYWSIPAASSAPPKKNPSTPSSKWRRLKEAGKLKKLVVAGCLSQRYPDELAIELPEVDLFIGTGEVPRIAEILREHEVEPSRRQYIGVPSYIYDHATPRLRTTPSYTAFLKVSEGCDHKCAFCIIPQLRGPHRSRSIDSVVDEASALAQNGVKEINLIAQDLTAYGRDRKDGTTLHGLLRRNGTRRRGSRGFACSTLIRTFSMRRCWRPSATATKSVNTSIFHFSISAEPCLQRMRRGKSGSAVREAVERLRDAIPGLTLRTSLIVGFPGESEADFDGAVGFCRGNGFREARRLQVLRGRGHRAAHNSMGKVSEQEKERRWQEVMDLQSTISRKKNEALIGSIQRVMIDGVDPDSGRALRPNPGPRTGSGWTCFVEEFDRMTLKPA